MLFTFNYMPVQWRSYYYRIAYYISRFSSDNRYSICQSVTQAHTVYTKAINHLQETSNQWYTNTHSKYTNFLHLCRRYYDSLLHQPKLSALMRQNKRIPIKPLPQCKALVCRDSRRTRLAVKSVMPPPRSTHERNKSPSIRLTRGGGGGWAGAIMTPLTCK